MSFLDPVKGFGVTFSTMFKPVVTEDYPKQPGAAGPALPRPASAEPASGRPGEMRRLRAVRVGLPGRRDLRRGRDNTDEERYSPGERYGKNYQINYLRCIGCGLCIEACPTRSLTMTNEYELADDDRQRLIYTKDMLLAPLLPGMEQPPHPMRLGDRAGLLRPRARNSLAQAGLRGRRGDGAGTDPAEATLGGRTGRRTSRPTADDSADSAAGSAARSSGEGS